MPDAKEIEDLEPSTDPIEDAEATASNAANSSSAEGDDDDQDLLSVVRDAVAAEKNDVSASPAEGEEVEESDEEAEAEKGEERDADDYSDVPFSSHPRFRQLIAEKNSYKEDAQRYQNVQGFIDSVGISPEEARDALMIAGHVRTNPVEAWRMLQPTVQKLLVAAGEILPDDLRGLVERGEMSQAAALEVSRSRAGAQSAQAYQTFAQQQQRRQQEQSAQTALVNAATAWENDRRAKDPNFDAKMSALEERIIVLQHREGRPTTPEGVRAQLTKAYKGLAAPAKTPQPNPAPQPKRPLPAGQSAGNERPEGASTLDIIKARVGR